MNLKSILFITVLCAVITSKSFAISPPIGSNVKNVIDKFAESHINTDVNKLSKILSSDAVLKISLRDEVLSQSQASILKLMKQNEGIKQNCSTFVEIIASSNALVMAKVNFIYEGFTIENFLTLELDTTQNWKITGINKFFTEAESVKILSRR